MVMRWKVLELVQNAESLETILDAISKSDHFDMDREAAHKLLRDYIELVPANIRAEFEK